MRRAVIGTTNRRGMMLASLAVARLRLPETTAAGVRRASRARIAVATTWSVHGVAALATGDLLDGVSVEEATDATVDLLLRGINVTPGVDD